MVARLNRTSAVENSKRDHSPKWTGCEAWTSEQFHAKFHEAMDYYRLEAMIKDPKPRMVEWMETVGYDKDEIKTFIKIKDWRISPTMWAIADCLLRGMPAIREDFNQGRSSIEWLRTSINKAILEGSLDISPESKAEKKAESLTVTIQDRIREQAIDMSDDIEGAIDTWITDPEAFDPKAFKMVNMLRGKSCKAAHARYIKGFFDKGHQELLELSSGNADEHLREAYSRNSRKNVKKLIEFYTAIMAACEQIAAEAKVLKKPRAKKIKPAEELIKKLKFKAIDDKLGVVSVPPAGIIGAQGALVYNTKNRKIGYYIAISSDGLNVKGSKIVNFTVKSVQKTLRKPAEQLKELKEQNTQKRVETWLDKIKSVEIKLNGRTNSDIMILKVFK